MNKSVEDHCEPTRRSDSWETMKYFMDDHNPRIYYLTTDRGYYVEAHDGIFIIYTTLEKYTSDSRRIDAEEFEEKYKERANLHLREPIGAGTSGPGSRPL